MAGDWIKMRGNLWDDPRVAAICDATDQGEAAVIGGLYWLWASADQHTESGVMYGLSMRQIDRKTGIPGFADALLQIGWIADHPEGIRIVKFEEHNGTSAKRRCMEAQRKASGRNVSACDADKKQTGRGHDAPDERTETGHHAELEKEKEKSSSSLRSEDSGAALPGIEPAASTPQPLPDFDGENGNAIPSKAIVKLGNAWALPEQWGLDAEALGWEVAAVLKEAEKFRQHWTVGKGAGTRRSIKGWRQSWSNWLSNAEKFSPLRRVV